MHHDKDVCRRHNSDKNKKHKMLFMVQCTIFVDGVKDAMNIALILSIFQMDPFIKNNKLGLSFAKLSTA